MEDKKYTVLGEGKGGKLKMHKFFLSLKIKFGFGSFLILVIHKIHVEKTLIHRVIHLIHRTQVLLGRICVYCYVIFIL